MLAAKEEGNGDWGGGGRLKVVLALALADHWDSSCWETVDVADSTGFDEDGINTISLSYSGVSDRRESHAVLDVNGVKKNRSKPSEIIFTWNVTRAAVSVIQ